MFPSLQTREHETMHVLNNLIFFHSLYFRSSSLITRFVSGDKIMGYTPLSIFFLPSFFFSLFYYYISSLHFLFHGKCRAETQIWLRLVTNQARSRVIRVRLTPTCIMPFTTTSISHDIYIMYFTFLNIKN